MSRSREYVRIQRAKAIKRKKRICKECYEDIEWYKHDGQYSKGKVHCSCDMCRVRDHRGGHLLTRNEIFAINDLNDELLFYEASLRDMEGE